MAAKDGIENEVKFRVDDAGTAAGRLRSLGGKLIESGLERNIKFVGNGLGRTKDLLRLRSYGGSAIITHKSKPKSVKGYKAREETEVRVDSFEDAKKILERLGFEKSWIYEKRRQVWVLDGVEVMIDELPLIGNFVEIEGSPAEIRMAAKKLGFDMKDASVNSYWDEYLNYAKNHKLMKGDLVFSKG